MKKIVKLLLKFNSLTWFLSHKVFMRIQVPLLKHLGVRFSGTPKYISASVYFDTNVKANIRIGANSVVASEVMVLTHDYSIARALIYTGEISHDDPEPFISGDVVIGQNCFVGARSMILPGTNLGDNVIIAAGSVVKGEIEAGWVYGGTPAKKIMTLADFSRKSRIKCQS